MSTLTTLAFTLFTLIPLHFIRHCAFCWRLRMSSLHFHIDNSFLVFSNLYSVLCILCCPVGLFSLCVMPCQVLITFDCTLCITPVDNVGCFRSYRSTIGLKNSSSIGWTLRNGIVSMYNPDVTCCWPFSVHGDVYKSVARKCISRIEIFQLRKSSILHWDLPNN